MSKIQEGRFVQTYRVIDNVWEKSKENPASRFALHNNGRMENFVSKKIAVHLPGRAYNKDQMLDKIQSWVEESPGHGSKGGVTGGRQSASRIFKAMQQEGLIVQV